MSFVTAPLASVERLQITHIATDACCVQRAADEDLQRGLLHVPRSAAARHLYDERGAELARLICLMPGYYLCRLEGQLLRRHAADIVRAAGAAHLVEFGGCAPARTAPLLDVYRRREQACTYWPCDSSAGRLFESAQDLVADYPRLRVHALVGDYWSVLPRLPLPDDDRPRLYLALSNSLGQRDPWHAQTFLRWLRLSMREGDRLLLGVDRVKPASLLTAAYNDPQGLTEEFNRNFLRVINRRLDADFDPQRFVHRVVYNEAATRIEMYLEAREAHRVHFRALDRSIFLGRGERICTEISQKFSVPSLRRLLAAAGLGVRCHYEADRGYYSLLLAAPG